jgi:hypothetical protein
MDELRKTPHAGREAELKLLQQIEQENYPRPEQIEKERSKGKASFLRNRGWRRCENRCAWRDWLTGQLHDEEKAYATEVRRNM